jgi:hypothetical protein
MKALVWEIGDPETTCEDLVVLGERRLSGGLERWFSPRGQDMAFLLSRIGQVRPRSEMIKIKSNQIK